MKTVLITGSEGFVGRHFTQRLETSGWAVTGIDIEFGAMNFFTHVTNQFDLVIHAAAQSPHRKAIDASPAFFPYNVMLDSTMFDWAIRTAQPRVLYLSSCAVYPAVLQSHMMTKRLVEDFVGYDRFHLSDAFPFGIDPTPIDRYGWTKLIGEHMARAVNEAGGTRVTVVRPFSGYGSDQSPDFPFRAFIDRVKQRVDPFPIWGNGLQTRDWIHIDDIVKACMVLVEAKVTEPINLCTGVGTSMETVVQKMISRLTTGDPYEPMIAREMVGESLGADYRVGDPTRLFKYYEPKVSLDSGIIRALKEI